MVGFMISRSISDGPILFVGSIFVGVVIGITIGWLIGRATAANRSRS